MSKINISPMRINLILLVLLLGIAGTACSLGQRLQTETENDQSIQATEKPTDIVEPSITPVPTKTPVPTERTTPTRMEKPTLRPTWTPFPSKTLRPTWTASPTLSPTATPEVIPILKEDFSDPSTPWLKTSGKNYKMGIAGGKYFMTIEDNNVEITSSRSWLKLAEVRVEADVTLKSGGGYYGFSCRESTSSYYTLFITSDGYYGLGQTRNGFVDFIVYQKSDIIKTNKGATNHIRGDCRGNALTLFVNDKALIRKQVAGLGPGYVGMMAGTLDSKENLTVYFDNLVIWGP
ncbi:MAG TPA: hypothetical protein G4N95_00045 [Anaerolineae bacterium]|nr:hypothetical protein [Anaerolineae bacterium]